MMNVILYGPPFSGKSTVGKAFSETWQRPFFDTDDLLEQKVGMAISEFYKRVGEEEFRIWERKVLAELMDQTQSVIACGGGVIDPAVKKLGSITYLLVPAEVLWVRLLHSGRHPAYLDPKDPEGSFFKHVELRINHYQMLADYTVQADLPVCDIVEEIGARYGLK